MNAAALRQKILDFASREENIRLVVETGAFARDFPPADSLSDLDIEFYLQNSADLLESQSWIEGLGAVLICLPLENEGFNPTRLVIYESGAKVDFSLYDTRLLRTGFRSSAQKRGFLVHLDKDNAARDWQKLAPPVIEAPDAQTYRRLIDDFWLDTYNQAKYLARGDLWTAKFLDGEIKAYVLKVLEWQSAGRGADVWHLGHHLRNWTDSATWAEVQHIFAPWDAVDSRTALERTSDLFGRIAREVGNQRGFDYPGEVETGIRALIRKITP